MKCYCLIIFFAILFSCNNQRTVILPEVKHSKITKVLDVSPTYIFYDETQPDSTLLNRKNSISTTNWLVNVDKRLRLKQVLPYLQVLQNKRKKVSMHKNENAKSYFTCNDLSKNNLGFIEFTKVVYRDSKSDGYKKSYKEILEKNHIAVTIAELSKIEFTTFAANKHSTYNLWLSEFENHLKTFKDSITIHLNFNAQLSFQDYITIKSILQELDTKKIRVDNNEFIY